MRRIIIPVLCSAAFAASALVAQDVVLPDGKAKNLVQNSCTECHGLEEIVNNAMSRDEWRTTVGRMVKRGASVSPAEIDTVVDYLSVYFAADKVNVNTATAKDLQNSLGLTEAQANAVVEYRTKNGRIADFDAFVKAAGVDAKKLDPKKELVVF